MRLYAMLVLAALPANASAQTPREVPGCLSFNASGCAPQSTATNGSGGGIGSDAGGGIGSGSGSGGVGTHQAPPEDLSALPLGTIDALTATRDNAVTLQFKDMKQLQNYKSLSVER